eukprot:5455414-Pyramimonas_sp.AAC.1
MFAIGTPRVDSTMGAASTVRLPIPLDLLSACSCDEPSVPLTRPWVRTVARAGDVGLGCEGYPGWVCTMWGSGVKGALV